jgi:hypothetical protein
LILQKQQAYLFFLFPKKGGADYMEIFSYSVSVWPFSRKRFNFCIYGRSSDFPIFLSLPIAFSYKTECRTVAVVFQKFAPLLRKGIYSYEDSYGFAPNSLLMNQLDLKN